VVAAIVALTGLIDPCSSTSGAPDSSPATLDSSQKLVALTDAERGALCDWYAQRAGGYGRTIPCEASGVPMVIDDRATCIIDFDLQASEHPSCPTTVGQYQACAEFFLANWCAGSPPTPPPDCATFQNQCFPISSSGAPPTDGGPG
jgi:hypothetical protein